jgi:hypothetical protein
VWCGGAVLSTTSGISFMYAFGTSPVAGFTTFDVACIRTAYKAYKGSPSVPHFI